MFNKEYLIKAQELLEAEYTKNKRIVAERREEISEKIPEYQKLEEELAQTTSDIVAVVMRGGEDRADSMTKIKNKNLSVQSRMAEILEKNGYDADYLKPIYYCQICCDKGAVDGEWCDCVRRAAVKFAAEDLNNGALCTFEDFNLSLYTDEIVPKTGRSARDDMKRNLDCCRKFVEDFNGRGAGIFMMGATGLGKTHLSLSIANELIKKGFSVVYNSVPELVRTLNAESFNKNQGDSMPIVSDCDLLILDDLGAEHSSEYSASLVYQLVNTRLSKNKPIIASTNLDMGEIKERYQDRIWSRLFSMRVLLFYGTDNRLKTVRNNW
ncbi:MAG: ATP-binding protein [Oscillospiraceae bacterium]|nr:ATP-binding protein [Oscillospiraceae bacterium]